MMQGTKEAVRELILSAGRELTSRKVVKRRNEIIHEKSVHDAATWVDKHSENFLIRNLRKEARFFPYVVVSEERKSRVILGDEGELLVDPLEGTDNYRYKRHPYGTNIGIVENNHLVYAIFCDVSEKPMRIYEAEKGRGAFLYEDGFEGGEKLQVNSHNMHIAFNQWEDVNEDVVGENYAELLRFTRRLSTTYSDSGDLCGVAEGKYGGAVFVYREAAPWDMVTALAVEESGGVVTDLRGNRWDNYDDNGLLIARNGMIAAGREMHGKLRSLRLVL